MKTKTLLVAVVVIALSACATRETPTTQVAMVQSPLYLVGDNAVPAKPVAKPDSSEATADASDAFALKRLYWFFGGR